MESFGYIGFALGIFGLMAFCSLENIKKRIKRLDSIDGLTLVK